MGVIGELFPGKKLTHEGSEDSDGQAHTPRFDMISIPEWCGYLARTLRPKAERKSRTRSHRNPRGGPAAGIRGGRPQLIGCAYQA
ncbi:hypothetical protein ACRS6B_21615 [Nocardia asteroides]